MNTYTVTVELHAVVKNLQVSIDYEPEGFEGSEDTIADVVGSELMRRVYGQTDRPYPTDSSFRILDWSVSKNT